MEPPVAAAVEETKSEKTQGNNTETYECGLNDTEIVYKIAQELLPGLASSCVDNTTGGIFTSAGSVAVNMRTQMTDYLTQRSEKYVAEFILSEKASKSGLEISENPLDIITILIDDFSASKRNMFSRVSEWVLTDRREDRIDDFVQEMEINGFWLLARRECVAAMLLKNVDYKNAFHCNEICNSEEELNKHRSECKFRPMDCINEGCTTRYCAVQKDNHELVCPFMILPCEQKCSDFVMRQEMDRHCVTVCEMKVVNCAFYTVGCKVSIPRCNVEQHNADDLLSHLEFILRTAHKDASDADLKNRVEKIRNLSDVEELAKARDARALTYLIKDFESELGPLEVKAEPNTAESPKHDDVIKKEPQSPTKTESAPLLVKDDTKKDQPTEKTAITEELPAKEVKSESENVKETVADSAVKTEESKDKQEEEEKTQSQITEKVEQPVESPEQETVKQSSGGDEEELKKSTEEETVKQSSGGDEEESKKSTEKETVKQSSGGDEQESTEEETVKQSSGSDEPESKKSTEEETVKQTSGSDEQESSKSTEKETVQQSSGSDEQESTKSTEKETTETTSIRDKEDSSHKEENTHDLFYSDEEDNVTSSSKTNHDK